MKRIRITAADNSKPSADELLKEKMDKLKDNFNYAFDGIDKLLYDGNVSAASGAIDELSASLETCIETIARNIVE